MTSPPADPAATSVKSVQDAAYFGPCQIYGGECQRSDDYGGKTNIAFCQACGKAFIKTRETDRNIAGRWNVRV